MIYLFEDRLDRMNQLFKGKLSEEVKIISSFDCIDSVNFTQYLNDNFENAECVLFHYSFNFLNKDIKVEQVKDFFIEKQIPFAFFSGGMSDNLVEEDDLLTAQLNSGTMYNNINEFVAQFKTKGKINLPLLVFGKNYLLNTLIGLQNEIEVLLMEHSAKDNISEFLVEEIVDIVEITINEEELNNDKQKLTEWLLNEKPLLVDNVRKVFANFIKRHK